MPSASDGCSTLPSVGEVVAEHLASRRKESGREVSRGEESERAGSAVRLGDAKVEAGGRGAPPKNQDTTPVLANRHRSNATRRGFTLLELIVVFIVLALLATIVAPQIFGRVSDARIGTAKTQMQLLGTALDNYRLDTGAYPSTDQGLQALRQLPTRAPVPTNWRGPYLRKDLPLDPWGRPYLYASPGVRNATGFDLSTLGRDGKPGGTGEDADLIGQ
ncbi:MAG: type II secretion system major pseudopilin GspG [Gemmatimonadaceae bacterium]